MVNSLQQVLIFVLIPVVATTVGAVTTTFYAPPPAVRSTIQHGSAGIVFAAVAGELLPQMHERDPIAVIGGFALGVAVMLLVRWLIERGGHVGKDEATNVTGLIVTIGVDMAIDGLLIGIGFAAGAEQGILLTFALTIEVLFLGLAMATALDQAGKPRPQVIGVPVLLAILLALAALVGVALLGQLAGAAFTVVLSFGAAALLYLVTEELLVEAHEIPETPFSTAMFFVGFLTIFVIEMIV